MAFEIVDDILRHANRDAIHCLSIVGLVEELERLHKTQNDQVDRGDAIAAIDQPVVLAVILADAAHRSPDTGLVTTGPGSIDRDRGSDRGSTRVLRVEL